MSTYDKIKQELNVLIDEGNNLFDLLQDKDAIKFGKNYQKWYTRALKVVKILSPDRFEEFKSYYEISLKRKKIDITTYKIQDYIMGIGAPESVSGKPKFDVHNLVAIRLTNQIQILLALKAIIDDVLSDIIGVLFAELQDKELEVAKDLLKINKRAAGALAGVVLERHLQRIATNHNITISKKNPSISDLNDLLKKSNIYDITKWRKIQFLADIRNLCVHQKEVEPTEEQVRELISGVNEIIKKMFI